MTFTTKPDIDTDTATVEPSRYAKENSNFLNIDDARKINSTIFDHTYNGQTPPTDGAYSQRLSGKAADGSTREVIGLAKSISVMPGDHIDMEVYAKYVDLTSSSLDQALKTLVTNIAINAAPAGTVVDGLGYPTTTSSILPFPGLLAKSTSPSAVPKAYMNWLVFDRNYNLDMNKSGFQPISSAAKEDGISFSSNPEGGSHEHLTASVDISDPGYVYIWLSNDNDTPVEVYFDDFKVTQIKSPVVQTDDYYPFGLTFNSYQKENSLLNKYQYNGKELQTDLGLNWIDYGARMYQPEIARWGTSDPKSEKYVDWSSYNYVFNNPLIFIDPNGKEVVLGLNYKKNGERMKVGKDGLDRGQRRTLNKLQNLTNDKLTVNPKTAVVSISEKGSANSNKNLVNGTALIKNAIGTGRTITIAERIKGTGNTTTGGANPDASNGVGANSKIYVDNGNTTGGLNEDGSRTRPESIGLGHEIIHALSIAHGTVDDTSLGLADPDLEAQPDEKLKVQKATPITVEENRARIEENKLRKEHGEVLRRLP